MGVLSETYHHMACMICTKTITNSILCMSEEPYELESEALCGLCGKAPERVAHILFGCDALAQSKYLSRHDSALQVLFL